jgi:hypothetical protein
LSERTGSAPRSGGRTAEQGGKGRRGPAATTTGGTAGGGARGARRYPTAGATQGSAALKLSADRHTANRPAPDGQRAGAATRLRVAPPAPINAPRAPFIALVVAVVVAGVLGILMINTKTAENAFRIDTLEKQQTKLDSQQQELQKQIDANNSPGNLDAIARKLGLVKADNPAYIRLPDGKVFGIMKPGSGEVAVTAQTPAATPDTGR